MRPKYICNCNAVTEETIIDIYKEYNHSYFHLIQVSGATEGCGTCEDKIKEIINKIK